MKRIVMLAALLSAVSLAACQVQGGTILRLAISDPEKLLSSDEGLLGEEFQEADFKMVIVKPDPSIDYKLISVKPDSGTRYTMVVIDPKTKKEVQLPKKVEDKIFSILEKHEKKR